MVNPSWGYRPVRSVHPSRWHEKIEIAASKLKNIKITNYDFEKIINQDNNISTLMYVDPPYFLANQKNHYIESFNDKDHHRLNKVLKDTKHKFILSYDDCDEIRYMYKDFYIHDIDFIYRIENSNPNQNKRKKVNELIITNFKKKNQDSFSFIKEKITLKNKKIKKTFFEKIRSPIRYPGSKFQALKIIQNYILNLDYDEYWEPFFGGGAFFFAKPLAKKTILNDKNEDIMNFYTHISDLSLRKKLIVYVSSFYPTKQNFNELKNYDPKNNLERACKYFIINRTCYSGIMKSPNWGYDDNKSVQPIKWADRIETAGDKIKNAELLNLDFRTFFSSVKKNINSNQVFAFIDPPYYKADQKRAYSSFFNFQDHIDLQSILRKIDIKFLLTYDNCDEIKELYSWANVNEESWRYHTANSLKATRKIGKELLITNF